MRILSRTAQAETHKYCSQRICNRNILPFRFNLLGSEDTNMKVLLCGDNAKISSRLFLFMFIVSTGLLNLLFPYFFFDLVVVCNPALTIVFSH